MILTCPSCSTRFSAPDAAFADGARKVRCSQCKHAWLQEPHQAEAGDGLFDFDRQQRSAAANRQEDIEPPSDSPAPAETKESNSQEDIDALFEPDAPAAEAEGKPADDANGEDEPEPEAEAPLDAPPIGIAGRREAPAGGQGNAGAWVGWSVLVSIVVAALAAMTLLSETVVGAWPPAKRVYAMVGLPFGSPGDGLEIRNLEAHFEPGPGGPRLIVMGEIINVSRGAKSVPMVRVVLRDGPDGEPPVARLTGRQGSGILTSMADADALMVVPESQAVVEEGQLMQAIVLDDPRHVQDVPW